MSENGVLAVARSYKKGNNDKQLRDEDIGDDCDKTDDANVSCACGSLSGDESGDGTDDDKEDIEWTTDHDFVRTKQRVAKYFLNGRRRSLFRGTVKRFAPPSSAVAVDALWRIFFDDGDVEDFDAQVRPSARLEMRLVRRGSFTSRHTNPVSISTPRTSKRVGNCTCCTGSGERGRP